MNNQDQVPTIAELWDKLKAALDTNLEARLTSDATDNGKHGTPPSLSIAISEAKITALRQQLLERTETEWGMQIREIISDGIPALRVIFDHGVLFLDSADSKDLGACIQFGSWELEQRGKERKGD